MRTLAAPFWSAVVLFALSDVIAQYAEMKYGGDKKEKGSTQKQLDFSYTRMFAVAACAPFFNGGPLVWFYRGLDYVLGVAPTVRLAFCKMLATQLLYMPVSTPAFILLSKFFEMEFEQKFGTSDREEDSYTSSGQRVDPRYQLDDALVNELKTENDLDSIRWDADHAKTMGENFDLAWSHAENNFWESYTTSYFLWPFSDMFNFTIVVRYFGPNFRTTWDAGVTLIWNWYLSTVAFRKDQDFGNVLGWVQGLLRGE